MLTSVSYGIDVLVAGFLGRNFFRSESVAYKHCLYHKNNNNEELDSSHYSSLIGKTLRKVQRGMSSL